MAGTSGQFGLCGLVWLGYVLHSRTWCRSGMAKGGVVRLVCLVRSGLAHVSQGALEHCCHKSAYVVSWIYEDYPHF